MADNPLKKAAKGILDDDRNPLTNARVAREWAAIANCNGRHQLAEQWAQVARELEASQVVNGR